MYERFTDRARRVMQMAHVEMLRCGHQYIGTEYILLGILNEGTCAGFTVLTRLGADLQKIRQEAENAIAVETADFAGKLPTTPRAKKVIEFAFEEARGLKHNRVGTEHLLVGLLRDESGVGAGVLLGTGLTLANVRAEICSVVGDSIS